MGYSEYTPDPALQDWVKCFWSIAETASDGIQEVWPDGCVELCFHVGSIVHLDDTGDERRLPPVFVLGLQTRIVRVRAEGELRLLAARLFPFGPREWDEEALRHLASRVAPLVASGDFAMAIPLVEEWLLRQPNVQDDLIHALRRMYAHRGNISVAELSAAQGVSSRQLQRRFAEELGVPPKTVAKVVRFAESWSRLLSKPDMSLADLALDLGYSDQSHLTNEFTAFGRRSPRAFLKDLTKKA